MYTGNVGEDEARFASETDSRVTRVGQFIRNYRIDELPQFWNVLRGEMSIIGPRPEQPEYVDQYRESIPHYNRRHSVKPGITGWAQVRMGYAADEEENRHKVEHDLYYVKNYSIVLDLLIVYLTIKTILTGFGAR
jgi:lipopolysaccharide/colanic/teichoic acid biosynthesis glycosyltransferase